MNFKSVSCEKCQIALENSFEPSYVVASKLFIYTTANIKIYKNINIHKNVSTTLNCRIYGSSYKKKEKKISNEEKKEIFLRFVFQK